MMAYTQTFESFGSLTFFNWPIRKHYRVQKFYVRNEIGILPRPLGRKSSLRGLLRAEGKLYLLHVMSQSEINKIKSLWLKLLNYM